MADQAAMSDRRRARPNRVAGISGDDATYYVEEHESGWRVTYDDAPIGILKNAGDASRFACDIARIQAQIGRVTWVIVLAEVEEVHRFETRAGSIKPPIDHEAECPFDDDRGVKEVGGRAPSVWPSSWATERHSNVAKLTAMAALWNRVPATGFGR
jgi:hypothetical protein